MKQIGFKNFRKFENFPMMELAPITVIVGENNAGKSTIVKAILAYSDFLISNQDFESELASMADNDGRMTEKERVDTNKKLLKSVRFLFNTSYIAHIGTFKRALYNQAKDSTITFQADLGSIIVSTKIIGNRKDDEAVGGNVSEIEVYSKRYAFSLLFDLLNDHAIITFHSSDDFQVDRTRPRTRWDDRLAQYFNSFTGDHSIVITISDNWTPRSYGRDLIRSLIESCEIAISATLHPRFIAPEEADDIPFRALNGKPIAIVDAESMRVLKLFDKMMNQDSINRTFRFRLPMGQPISRMLDIEYIYAHAVTQTSVYTAKDANDYLSQTIHEFASRPKATYKKKFITKWMKEFEIGTDYSIRSVGGEAHIVYVTNKNGEKVNLADKGMGSIQLMVLLFRLAITLPNRVVRGSTENRFGKVIIIEEPEQNLHPTLQSQLADLFYEINRLYGYRFIIETHSEYLIRKMQVIVSNLNEQNSRINERYLDDRYIVRHNENPFKVYYVPSDEAPYEMIFRPDGRFENEFGKGFFDKAAELAFEIL